MVSLFASTGFGWPRPGGELGLRPPPVSNSPRPAGWKSLTQSRPTSGIPVHPSKWSRCALATENRAPPSPCGRSCHAASKDQSQPDGPFEGMTPGF